MIRKTRRYNAPPLTWREAFAAFLLAGLAGAGLEAFADVTNRPGGAAGPAAVPDLIRPASEPVALTWLSDLDAALALAGREYRKVLVLVTLPDCAYCRRLKAELLPLPEVRERLDGFVAVELDASVDERSAGRFGIEGVPTLLVLSSDGRVDARLTGMPSRDALLELLSSAAGEAAGRKEADAVRALLDRVPALSEEEWAGLMARLGDRGLGDDIRAGLVGRAALPRPVLARLLDHPRLAVRLGTIEVLEELAGRDFGYDPWETDRGDGERAQAMEAWQAWAAVTGAADRAAFSALTADQVADYLRDAVSEDGERGRRAVRMLARGGPATLSIVDAFLAEHPGLGWEGRTRLREARLALLLPRRRGVDAEALAHRLVAGNRDVQLRALRDLTRFGAEAERVLVEFLASEESVVRETAVDALAAALGPRSVPLLAAHLDRESETDVQIAALRVLGNLGDPAGLPAVTSFLKHPDEDTVIAALGSLAKFDSVKTGADLAPCLADPRWRVRVAALDAAARLKTKDVESELLARLDDPEPFVRFKAVEAVAEVLGKRAARRLEKVFLAEDSLKAPVLKAYGSLDAPLPDSFVAALDGADPGVLVPVLQVLADNAARGYILIERVAAHPDLDVACSALRLLSRFVTTRAGCRALVLAALRDGPREKRLAVLDGLQAIESRGSVEPIELWEDLAPSEEAGAGFVSLVAAVLQAFDAGAGAAATAGVERAGGEPAGGAPGLGELFGAFGVGGGGSAATGALPAEAGADVDVTAIVEEVKRLLEDGDDELRLEAALALLQMGRSEPVPWIESHLAELTASERERVAGGLAGQSDEAALSLLSKLLGDAADGVRRAAADCVVRNLQRPGWADALFGELVRPGTPLRPADVYGYALPDRARKSQARRTVSGWIEKLLSQEGRPDLAVFGLVLMESTGRAEDAGRIEPLLADGSPWVRRAAYHALAALDSAAFAARAAGVAGDPSEDVRLVLPATVVKGGEWQHVVDEKTSLNRYEGSGVRRDPYSRLSAADRDRLVSAVGEMTRDASPRVRFEAALALVSRAQPVSAAVLVGAAEELPDQEAVGRRIGSAVEEQYRRLGADFAAALPYLRHARMSREKREQIRRHFGEGGAAPAPPPPAMRDGAQRPAAPAAGGPEPLPPAPASPGRARVVFFSEPGCPECALVRQYLDEIRASFPEIEVEERDIGLRDTRMLGDRLYRRFEVPEEQRFVSPALFSGAGCLVKGEITFDRLADLVVRSLSVPPGDWYPAIEPEPAPREVAQAASAPAPAGPRVSARRIAAAAGVAGFGAAALLGSAWVRCRRLRQGGGGRIS